MALVAHFKIYIFTVNLSLKLMTILTIRCRPVALKSHSSHFARGHSKIHLNQQKAKDNKHFTLATSQCAFCLCRSSAMPKSRNSGNNNTNSWPLRD